MNVCKYVRTYACTWVGASKKTRMNVFAFVQNICVWNVKIEHLPEHTHVDNFQKNSPFTMVYDGSQM
jgi:hypothetical protein